MEQESKKYKALSQQELKEDMLDMIKRNDAASLRKALEGMSEDELRARALAVAELLKDRDTKTE